LPPAVSPELQAASSLSDRFFFLEENKSPLRGVAPHASSWLMSVAKLAMRVMVARSMRRASSYEW
jgi:hypothetical protein